MHYVSEFKWHRHCVIKQYLKNTNINIVIICTYSNKISNTISYMVFNIIKTTHVESEVSLAQVDISLSQVLTP